MMYSKHAMYIRTQIQLSEDYYERLRDKAHRERTSIAELIRRGVGYVIGEKQKEPKRLKEKALAVVGRFKAKGTDVAKEHDRYLAEIYRK